MNKKSKGACLGFIIGLIFGIILTTILIEACNIKSHLDIVGSNLLEFRLALLTILVPVPSCVILFSIIGYLVVANIDKKPFKSKIIPKKKDVEPLREIKLKEDIAEKQVEKEVLPSEPIPIIKTEEDSEQLLKKVISLPESQPEPTPSVIIKNKIKDKELIEGVERPMAIEIREDKLNQDDLIKSQDLSTSEKSIEKLSDRLVITEESKDFKEEKEIAEPLKNICPFCGYESKLNKTYCYQCGYKLKN